MIAVLWIIAGLLIIKTCIQCDGPLGSFETIVRLLAIVFFSIGITMARIPLISGIKYILQSNFFLISGSILFLLLLIKWFFTAEKKVEKLLKTTVGQQQEMTTISMPVEQIVKERVKELGSTVYIAPAIEEKKLNNAVTAIAQGIDPAVIVAIVDTTFFNSAKGGLVFTSDTLYYRYGSEKPVSIPYADIKKTEHKITKKTYEKRKETFTEIVDLFDKEGKVILNIKDLSSLKHDKFFELLNAIIPNFKDGDRA